MAEEWAKDTTFDARAEARGLVRTAREAGLATLDRASGAPFVTLVGVASDYDGAPLLLLSTLSSHTKNLAADSRASLLLASPRGRGDPLNRPRLTLVGALAKHPDATARARYLTRNPKVKLYADFADFAIFRLQISAVHFNGGFARAAPLAPADVATDLAGAEALIGNEGALLRKINARGRSYLARLAGPSDSDRARWRAIGLDPDGLDLAAGAAAARASFAIPTKTPTAWLQSLERLAEQRAVRRP
jgi:hypothetical protein